MSFLIPSLIPFVSVLHCFFSQVLGNTVKFHCFQPALCLEFAASNFLPRKNTWAGRIVSFSPCVITGTKKRKFSCSNKIFNLSSNKRYHLFLLKLPGETSFVAVWNGQEITRTTMPRKVQGDLLNEGFKGCGSPILLPNVVRVSKEFQILLLSLLIK